MARIWFDAPQQLSRFIAAKGSVALDGVSLTVNEVAGDRFAVLIVPHTLDVTTFAGLRPGRPGQSRSGSDGPLCGAIDRQRMSKKLGGWLSPDPAGSRACFFSRRAGTDSASCRHARPPVSNIHRGGARAVCALVERVLGSRIENGRSATTNRVDAHAAQRRAPPRRSVGLLLKRLPPRCWPVPSARWRRCRLPTMSVTVPGALEIPQAAAMAVGGARTQNL